MISTTSLSESNYSIYSSSYDSEDSYESDSSYNSKDFNSEILNISNHNVRNHNTPNHLIEHMDNNNSSGKNKVSFISTTSTPPPNPQTIANVHTPTTRPMNIFKTTLVVIDSSDRDNNTDLTNDYTYTLPTHISNSTEIELLESHIKDTSYNINSYNNFLRININVFGKKQASDVIENIIIPPGNYYQNSQITTTNLDDKLNNMLSLYDEFSNIKVVFNYNSEKYYIYQRYSNIVEEHSNIFNIFLNFGKTEYVSDLTKTGLVGPTINNPLFQNINKSSYTPTKKIYTYAPKTIGKYLGFNPAYYSSYISSLAHIYYYKNENDIYTLRFTFIKNIEDDSESKLLFDKLYEVLLWAQDDMFIGFKLSQTWKDAVRSSGTTLRTKTEYLILKIFPSFANNIITHLSTENVDSSKSFIQLTLENPLHQWPEYNIVAPPDAYIRASSDTYTVASDNEINNELSNIIPISDDIIMPIISDNSYELNNNKYMLMQLNINGSDVAALKSKNTVINNSFCQFKTDHGNGIFRALGHSNIVKYPTKSTLNTFKIKLKDMYNNNYDLNNKNHSFTLRITHKHPTPK